MPPLVYETVAWFRRYSWLPVPPMPGENEPATADPARNAYAAPIAGAAVGALAGVVMMLASAMDLSDFAIAASGAIALIAITGGRAEQALAGAGGSNDPGADTGSAVLRWGIVAIALAVLLRTGALDALLLHGVWRTVFALIAACAVARAAAIGFALLRSDSGAPATGALQWLAIAGIAIGIAAVLPAFGLGPAIAAIAAAAGAVALASAFQPQTATGSMPVAELAAEIAFLIALVAFASSI